jgi:hypothetical protein
VLLCRNSTDTKFFQRLRPYPRVYLLASNVHFREWDNTPNGFGVVLVCIAPWRAAELHERFLRTFEHYGEASAAVDGALGAPALRALLSRCAHGRTVSRHAWRNDETALSACSHAEHAPLCWPRVQARMFLERLDRSRS